MKKFSVSSWFFKYDRALQFPNLLENVMLVSYFWDRPSYIL